MDIHDPKGNRKTAGFTDEERKNFTALLKQDFIDVYRLKNQNQKQKQKQKRKQLKLTN